MFKTTYDPEADAFAVYFGQRGTTVESSEVAPGITLSDFDAAGLVIGIEVLGSVSVWRRRPARSRRSTPSEPASLARMWAGRRWLFSPAP